MKDTVKTLTGALCASSLLLAGLALAGQPGKGWDTFNNGSGEPIAPQQVSTVASGAPGKGWDTFNNGAGERIAVQKLAIVSAGGAPGKGWDTFNNGGGEAFRAAKPVQLGAQ